MNLPAKRNEHTNGTSIPPPLCIANPHEIGYKKGMNIQLTPEALHVEFSGLETLLGLHGAFRIPRNQVASAWQGMPKSVWKELRMPGSFFPGLIKAGTYLTPRGKEYWYVTRRKRHPVTIELTGHSYTRLVLGVEDPAHIPSLGLPLNQPPAGIDAIRS